MAQDCKVIGIAGGSGSGKTTVVKKIADIVPEFVFLPQDNYYRSAEFISNSNITSFNFDHPEAFDKDLLYHHIKELKEGRSIEMPQYDFVHHRRLTETITLHPSKVVIFEGILILFDGKIRDLIDLKLFVDTPQDIRFIRRLQRDIDERGRTMESVIAQYLEVVRPGHNEFIEPTKAYADLIIPEGGRNSAVLEVLASFVRSISNGSYSEAR